MQQHNRTVWGAAIPAECASCGAFIFAGDPVVSDQDGNHYCATFDGVTPAHPTLEEERERRRLEAQHETAELFDKLCEEIYYGFNLRCILVEATRTERRVLKTLLRRAANARREAKARRINAEPKP